jgi:hypothetical protein
MMTELESYRALFEASAISVDTAQRAGVYAVSEARAHDLGFNGTAAKGLIFPYRHPKTGRVGLIRLRPDQPISVAGQVRKYVAPEGSRNELYFPLALSEHFEDPRFDVVIVEGEKKYLAVVEAVGTRYFVIGIPGVWNWRTSDKTKVPNAGNGGTHWSRTNSRPIEDLDTIVWKGRRVFIVFDSDGDRNQHVQAAEHALVVELRKRGAAPLVVTLPAEANGGKQGIDDLLAQQPADRRLPLLERLFRGAAPRRKLAVSAEHALDLRYEPSGGFMRSFDEYADAETDAPAVFRPFTALAILAAVVGRRVTAPWFGASALVPNLFITILAPSSFSHKTTMISMAERLIRATNPDVLLPDDFTPEKFVSLLRERPQAFLSVPEFAGFLRRADRDYNAGVKELLMQLYDAPERYERALQRERVVVEKPSVTLLAASATSWLADQLKGGDLRSGFFNRFCFVLSEHKTKSYALPGSVEGSPSLRPLLLSQLKAISALSGVADYRRIRQPYEAWYRDVEREAGRAEQQEIVSAFYARLATTVMKFTVLLELSMTQSFVITGAAFEEAVVLADYIRAVVRRLLRAEFAQTEDEKAMQRVLRHIQMKPGATRKILLQHAHVLATKLTPVLSTLEERGDIYRDGTGDGAGFWAR